MTARLEHANICVRDLDGVIRFLRAAFPEFRIRHDAVASDGTRWVHVGTDETYIALSQARPGEVVSPTPYQGRPGLNHLAYEVPDVAALMHRLHEGGFVQSAESNGHPYRRRVYFYDPDGNDWEFVQYLSTDPAKRHDYTLPDSFTAQP